MMVVVRQPVEGLVNKVELLAFEQFGAFDNFDEGKGTYRALVATLDVVNANRRMLASGVLGGDTPTVFVSEWNHSSARDYSPPVAKATISEQDKIIYATMQHDLSDEASMRSFKRNMFFKDELQFSLAYQIKEYSINYEEEFIKVIKAEFVEVTPAALGASPGTKVIDQGKEMSLDTWLNAQFKGEEKKEEGLKSIATTDMLNELRRRKYDFSILTIKED